MKGFNFDDLIKNIIDRTNDSSKQKQSKGSKENASKRIFKTVNPQKIDVTPSIQSAFTFVQNILDNSLNLQKLKKKQRQQELLKIKNRKFMMQLSIEPVYFIQDKKITILNFQFQLGASGFLQRIQKLYQQLHNTENCIENITGNPVLIEVFDIYDQHLNRIRSLHQKIKETRAHINKVKEKAKKGQAKEKMQAKQIILKKISYLKSIKNQRNFLQLECDNIDKVFYSERERTRMYNKLVKAENLIGKIECLKNWRHKLIEQAKNSIRIVEINLKKWQDKQLNVKEIQKMLIAIYYIQKEVLYKNNQLQINWSKMGLKCLSQRINQVRSWQNFRYVDISKNADRIQKLLLSLDKKVIQ